MEAAAETLDAHYYLVANSSNPLTREAFLAAIRDAGAREPVFLLYVGSGYVPLTFAVMAPDEMAAVETMEDWCRCIGRAEEIGEAIGAGNNGAVASGGAYELTIQRLDRTALQAVARR